MKFKKYPATQLFSQIIKIKESSFKKEKRLCEFPFNLNFSINKNFKQKNEFTGPGIYIFTEVDQLYGIIMKSSIAYVGKTTRSLGSRAKEHFRDCVDPNFHHWLGKVEKNKKLMEKAKRI